MAIGHQSFYQTQLTSSISDTDLVIPVDNPPIPSEGFLVIEGTVEAKREIIYYTSKDGTSVTCPSGAGNGRGYDGTTAVSHLQGAAVVMAPVGAMFDQLGDITVNSITIGGTPSAEGWSPLGATPDTVTANGNKSYDLVFNGTDLTDTISEGMRVRSARTVAAPVQCTSLNGTTQYYSKTSPNKTTFVGDHGYMSGIKPTTYQNGYIVCRITGGNTGFALLMTSSGQIQVQYGNGASLTQIMTYQSVPLNKWTTISVAVSVAAKTAVVLFDGVSVPTYLVAGTATTVVQPVAATALVIGADNAGANCFAGKLAQVGLFTSAPSTPTLLGYISQGLTGTETNLASAYSFSNSITDLNTTTPNDLTANGSAVATNADSPFGNSGVSTTIDYGIVMKKAFSTNTTLTIQVPEGCTIPTSGGVASMDYSINDVPYGFVRAKGKWQLLSLVLADLSQTSPTVLTWYNVGGYRISAPTGMWRTGYNIAADFAGVGSSYGGVTLSTTTNTETDRQMTGIIYDGSSSETIVQTVMSGDVALTTPTPLYFLMKNSTGTSSLQIRGALGASTLTLENAYL
jgi:hypothetical protein